MDFATIAVIFIESLNESLIRGSL